MNTFKIPRHTHFSRALFYSNLTVFAFGLQNNVLIYYSLFLIISLFASLCFFLCAIFMWSTIEVDICTKCQFEMASEKIGVNLHIRSSIMGGNLWQKINKWDVNGSRVNIIRRHFSINHVFYIFYSAQYNSMHTKCIINAELRRIFVPEPTTCGQMKFLLN